MSGGEKEYRRLPGRSRKLMGASTLWLGKDHLLLVDWQGFHESYKRFYYRDIRSIVTRRTDRSLIISLIFGALFAAMAAAAGLADDVGRIAWSIPAAAFLTALLINVARGTTCVSNLSTIAQNVRLPFNRLRKTRKAITLLRARIEEAQGSLNTQEIPAQATEAPAQALSAAITGLAPPPVPDAIRPASGLIHAVLFASLLLDGILTSVSMVTEHPAAYVAALLLLLCEFGLVIGSIIRQHETDLPASVRTVVWASLAYLCFAVLLAIGSNFIDTIRGLQGQAAGRSSTPVIDIFAVATPFLLAGWGFLVLQRFRRSREDRGLSILGGRS